MKIRMYKALMGKRVTFDARLVRKVNRVNGRSDKELEWVERSIDSREGVIVGIRYKQNGDRVHIGYEEGWAFKQKGTVKSLLVYTHPLKRPIYVPFRFAEPLLESLVFDVVPEEA